jgi:hypothetical protein
MRRDLPSSLWIRRWRREPLSASTWADTRYFQTALDRVKAVPAATKP